MHIFISAYVLLALASWSALAAPLSWSKRNNRNVAAPQKYSSSSILMGRQGGLGLETVRVPVPTSDDSNPPSHSSIMDCDPKSKSTSKNNDNSPPYVTGVTYANGANLPTAATISGIGPAVAGQRLSRPMRRDSNGSPDIFERDDAHTTGASNNPVTVEDVLGHYFQQMAAARKRARSPRISRDFN